MGILKDNSFAAKVVTKLLLQETTLTQCLDQDKISSHLFSRCNQSLRESKEFLSFHWMHVAPQALRLASGDVAKLDLQTSNTLVLGLIYSPLFMLAS